MPFFPAVVFTVLAFSLGDVSMMMQCCVLHHQTTKGSSFACLMADTFCITFLYSGTDFKDFKVNFLLRSQTVRF